MELPDIRPISLLCIIAKAFEKIVCEQVTLFVESNNILDDFQSGFRKKHSCCTALLKITEDIRLAIERKEYTILCTIRLQQSI
jgi:hypothetical protein